MLTSPTLMANIAKLLQNPKVLQSLMSAGLVASEAVKGKKNKGARAGLMISNALLGMFDEDGPFKDPLKGTIFSKASPSTEQGLLINQYDPLNPLYDPLNPLSDKNTTMQKFSFNQIPGWPG